MLFGGRHGGYRPLGGHGQRTFARCLPASPEASLTIILTMLFLLTIQYLHAHSYRDPTSAFWDPDRGYDKNYSLRREAEAEAFIAEHNVNSSLPRSQQRPSANPALCLGIATVARPKVQYIQRTVGSVLQGLTAEERERLHFIFFIAHSKLSAHPVSGQPWTVNLPDRLLDYDRSDNETLDKIRGWEETGNHREKGFYDYTHLLKACKETGAPYIAMLEGDVLAVPGWLGRSIDAAQYVDWTHGRLSSKEAGSADSTATTKLTTIGHISGSTTTTTMTSPESAPPWLYIRLFWTETYLGWNNEDWPTYVSAIGACWILLATGMLAIRHMVPQARPVLSNGSLLLILLLWFPLWVALYFAAGRMTVQRPGAGTRRMEEYGCCSQGMVFSAAQVPTLLDAIERRIEGYMDMLLETLARQTGLERWAVFPSLLQHIGGESSKGDPVSDARARMIWNFGFERYGEMLQAGRQLW